MLYSLSAGALLLPFSIALSGIAEMSLSNGPPATQEITNISLPLLSTTPTEPTNPNASLSLAQLAAPMKLRVQRHLDPFSFHRF
jgi:hypothetical protein